MEPIVQSTAVSVTPSYRRNGKLFSCEPCRRGKLRCDHNSPICGRCARRNKPDQCIYHPAPLTKPRASPGGVAASQRSNTTAPSRSTSTPALPYPTVSTNRRSGLASPPSSSGAHPAYEYPPPPPLRTGSGLPLLDSPASSSQTAQSPLNDKRTPSSTSRPTPETAMSFRDSRTGFLGPTSYSAVYTENPSILEALNEHVDDAPTLSAITPEKLQQGVNVLTMLRDMPVYRRFTQRWFDICEGIIVPQPVFRIWIDELWKEFGQILTDSNPEQLRALSELVWQNTRRPMKTHRGMTAREWAKSASGLNLRWEVVGIVLSMVGLVAVNLSNWDTIFDETRSLFVDRATFAERMRKASEYCLCFCYESEVLNYVYVCFMFGDLVLVENLKGDAHYAAWQRTGEVCDAIVALGLHQGNAQDADTSFFLSQLRKKIFISVYGHDKGIATFLGRPPRLSQRYCKMEAPLDLSDDQLCSEGPELEALVASLDPQGWNTRGDLHRTTWCRAWFQHCRIREDILELALGSGEQDITRQAEDIRLKMHHLQDSFPSFMMVTPEQMFSDSSRHGGAGFPAGAGDNNLRQINAIFVIYIHCGLVHTEFLLQRALVNRTRTDTKQLIPLSRRLLQLVLLAQSRREFFRDFQGDLIYLLAIDGLPAAGVLAVEMLKQEQTRQYTPDLLPRSETIQDLSVFISALAAVGPGEGNFKICDQGRRALRRVLDQILSPSHHPPLAPSLPGGGGGGDPPLFDDPSLYFPTGNDADFLQWLDNVEWDKNQWVDPAQDPGPAVDVPPP